MSMERPEDSTSSVEDEDEDKYEDDLQTLIPQNQPPSPIEIATNLAAAAARRFSSHKRYYLLALSLPLLLLLLYLSATSAPFLHSPTPSPSPSDRLLESQLQALFLLKSQQSSLLTLLNHTTSNATSLDDQDFRSALLDQIRTNRQIQKALLSSHRPRNLNSTDNVGPDLDNYELDACKKVEWPADRKTIEWKPNNKDRFLFAVCVSGQMSNHLICLEKHMFFAALLDRVLVFPSHKVDYRYDEVLDLKRINECFGREVVVSFDEFVERRKGSGKVRIDRFICYMASPPCFLDEEHVKRLKELGVGLGRIEAAWPEDGKLKVQKKRVVEDVMAKFSADAEVIAIGDMFYADVEEEWVMQPGGPLKHKCRTLIQPSRLIILTAQRFVQTFLGNNFIALHFRRHGFLKFCNMKEESCFFPIPQAAECILQVVAKSNAPVIYLSTDAAESETDLLQSLLVPNDNNKKIPLVKRPNHNTAEKWDALLYRNRLGGNNQVEAMLDKTICAMSNVFIGASGSTFTEDIIRLRRGWGSSSKCDGYLCQGERPNFIAENE